MYRPSPFGFYDPYQQYYAPRPAPYYGMPAARPRDEPEDFDPHHFMYRRQPQQRAPQPRSTQHTVPRKHVDDTTNAVHVQVAPTHGSPKSEPRHSKNSKQQQKQLLLQRQQALLRKVQDRAARRLQTWWRGILAPRVAERREHSACIIQRFIREATARRRTARFLDALHALRTTEHKLTDLHAAYIPRLTGRAPGTSKDMLAYENAVDKLILSLDGIDIHGNDVLRAERKRIVRVAQTHLDAAAKLDSSARTVQQWWRLVMQRRREARKPAAVHVITRALRAARARRQASIVVDKIKAARALEQRLSALMSKTRIQLRALAVEARHLDQQGSDAVHAHITRLCDKVHALDTVLALHSPGAAAMDTQADQSHTMPH